MSQQDKEEQGRAAVGFKSILAEMLDKVQTADDLTDVAQVALSLASAALVLDDVQSAARSRRMEKEREDYYKRPVLSPVADKEETARDIELSLSSLTFAYENAQRSGMTVEASDLKKRIVERVAKLTGSEVLPSTNTTLPQDPQGKAS